MKSLRIDLLDAVARLRFFEGITDHSDALRANLVNIPEAPLPAAVAIDAELRENRSNLNQNFQIFRLMYRRLFSVARSGLESHHRRAVSVHCSLIQKQHMSMLGVAYARKNFLNIRRAIGDERNTQLRQAAQTKSLPPAQDLKTVLARKR